MTFIDAIPDLPYDISISSRVVVSLALRQGRTLASLSNPLLTRWRIQIELRAECCFCSDFRTFMVRQGPTLKPLS